MNYIDYCLVCGSKKLDAFTCNTVPFISERIWQKKPFKVKLLRCSVCRFASYNLRLENDEVARLYKDYRGDEYQEQRQKHEQTYTKEFNNNLGNNQIEIINRKNNLSNILRAYLKRSEFANILDYGGDYGQFIPDHFSESEKYVYEISGAKPLEGVKLVTDIEEVKKHKFDFIMCCHVLEHVSFPRAEIENLKMLGHKNSVFYFEVPVELVNVLNPSGIFKSLYHQLGKDQINPLSRILILIRELFRYFLVRTNLTYNLLFPIFGILGLNLLSMHEHINFFTSRSMKLLLESCGLKVLYADSVSLDANKANTSNKADIISCLATFP